MPNYPWFELRSDTQLEQGDIIEDFPIFTPDESGSQCIVETYTLILMSQSCDIDELDHLTFCPLWTKEQILRIESNFFKDGKIGALRKYQLIGWHPIQECDIEQYCRPWRIIQFNRVFDVEKSRIIKVLEETATHIRLLSPYRENMAQDFARLYMRVGLPIPLSISL